MPSKRPLTDLCRVANDLVLVFLTLFFILLPGATLLRHLSDPGLRSGGGVPRCAFDLHRALSPDYERWARDRVASGVAEQLGTNDISGTEWPLFGSVFYLWSTVSLEEAWAKDNSLAPTAPMEYARGAVEATAALVADPKHARWVRDHWGDDYLHQENVFYRELLIGGLTAHQKHVADGKYLPLIRDQAETLSKALDASPYGLLDDYPGECYPVDVVGALAAIQQADVVLGTDRSAFIKRSLRAFHGERTDEYGLPVYNVDSRTGQGQGFSRGCGNSFILTWAPELWPEQANDWYAQYDKHFWQDRWWARGYRENARETPAQAQVEDVDSGPVVAGFGTAASAFGVGAARANGRFDHAYPLSAEMLCVSWPLPGGTLLIPRVLSNAIHAPHLADSAILFALTRTPPDGLEIRPGKDLPVSLWLVLGLFLLLGGTVLVSKGLAVRRILRDEAQRRVPAAAVQFVLWCGMIAAAAILALAGEVGIGCLIVLLAQFVPRGETREEESSMAETPGE